MISFRKITNLKNFFKIFSKLLPKFPQWLFPPTPKRVNDSRHLQNEDTPKKGTTAYTPYENKREEFQKLSSKKGAKKKMKKRNEIYEFFLSMPQKRYFVLVGAPTPPPPCVCIHTSFTCLRGWRGRGGAYTRKMYTKFKKKKKKLELVTTFYLSEKYFIENLRHILGAK